MVVFPFFTFMLFSPRLVFLVSFAQCYETKVQASEIARSILSHTTLGELSTIMIARNSTVDNYPFATVEYIVDDCSRPGQLLMALVSWGHHATNVKANPNASVFIRNKYWYKKQANHRFRRVKKDDRGLMDHPRFTAFGSLEPSPDQNAAKTCLCFKLKDTRWMTGHLFILYTLDIKAINFVGGYGDEHYVGWLDMNDYFHRPSLLEIQI